MSAVLLALLMPLAARAQLIPSITSPLTATGTVDAPFSYTITADGNPPITYSVLGSLHGLSYTAGPPPTISGAPTALQISATLMAMNASGTDIQTLLITNTTYRPVFTSTLQVTATEGFPFRYEMTAAGDAPITYNFDPVAYAEKGSGIFLIGEATGDGTVIWTPTIGQVPEGSPILSGTSMREGSDTLTLTATNALGMHQVDLKITGTSMRPVFTSKPWINLPVGQSFNFQLEATHSPTYFDAYDVATIETGTLTLPPGWSINHDNGLISGSAGTEGATEIAVIATNQYGSRMGSFKVAAYVTPAPADKLLWTDAADVSGTAVWDTTTQNWRKGGAIQSYSDGQSLLFDDSSATETIVLGGTMTPTDVLANISGRTLTIISSPTTAITGTAPLIKQGSGTLAFKGDNTAMGDAHVLWNGVMDIQEGTVDFWGAWRGSVEFHGGNMTVSYRDSSVYWPGNQLWVIPTGVYAELNLPNRFNFNGSVLSGGGTLCVNYMTSVSRFDIRLRDSTAFTGELIISGSGGIRWPDSNAGNLVWEGLRNATVRLEHDGVTDHRTWSGGATLHIGALAGNNPNARLGGGNSQVTFLIGEKGIDTFFAGSFGDPLDPAAPGTNKTRSSIRKIGPGIMTVSGIHNHEYGTSVENGGVNMTPTAKFLGARDVSVSGSGAFGGAGQVRPNVNFADGATLLVDVDPDTGEVGGMTVNSLVTFAGSTVRVRPIVRGGAITNGVYTALFSDLAFSSQPMLEWYYPKKNPEDPEPTVQAAFEYLRPNEIQVTITGGVIPKPKITSPLRADVMVNDPFTYTFTAVGDTTVETILNVANLPEGLSFAGASGIISGALATSGDKYIDLFAINPSGTTSATMTLRVYDVAPPPPVITSPLMTGIIVDRPGRYQIEADNFPTRFTAEGLPRGLSVDANGLISGKCDSLGTYPITITAANISGTDTEELTLIVALPPPTVLVVSNTIALQNMPFSHQIAADNEPSGYAMSPFVEVVNNVSGTTPVTYLTLDGTTGIMTGICPNLETTGTIPLRITGTVYAWNPTGTGWAPLTITVNPQRPVILESGEYGGIVGVPFSHAIQASNMYPAYSRNYGVTNMPRGLNINPKSGQIGGTPLVSGVFRSAFVASNITASGAQLVTFVINGASILGTLAGKAVTPGSTDGPATDARFNLPGAAVSDKNGNLYIADIGNNSIRKIAPDGTVSTLASGVGQSVSIIIDPEGTTLYVADAAGNAIKKIDVSSGVVTALAVTGSPALNAPHGLAIDTAGNLYVADTGNHLVRKIVLASGAMTTLAGSVRGSADGAGAAAGFDMPSGLTISPDGAMLYVADTGNSIIRSITTADGDVITLAGTAGEPGSADAIGSLARFNTPEGLAFDAAGVLYVADTGNHTIRSIDIRTGKVITFAGTAGTAGSTDGNVVESTMNLPRGVTIDADGQIYVLDTDNHTVRMLQVGPDIVTPPSDQRVPLDSEVEFGVVASGAPLPTYQWYKDDLIIPGATESTLVLDALQLTDVGDYKVLVMNPLGTRVATAYLSLSDVHPSNPGDAGVSGGGDGGGGGGAPSLWYLSIVAFFAIWRSSRRRRAGAPPMLFLLAVGALLFASAPDISAQAVRQAETGIVTGRVLNQATGQYLSDARVTVDGTTLETLTDSTGSFRLINVPAGPARISANYTGLDTITKDVMVPEGATTTADFDLTAEVYVMEKFVVAGAREGAARAIQEQRVSVSQKAIFAADSFGNIVDNNIGELMKNLPGVTIDYEGEDAATMRIRGMDPEFANVTLDGNEVATVGVYEDDGTDVDDSRAFNLQTTALQNIESIELKIAPTPEDPGTSMGGLVNIKTKSALSQKGRRLYFTTNLSINTAELDFDKSPGGARTPNRKIQPGFNLGWSETFGTKQLLGVAFDVGFTRTYRYNNNYRLPGGYLYDSAILAQNGNRVTKDTPGFVNSLLWTESGKSEEKRMVSLSLDYQPWGTTNHSFFLRSSYNDTRGLGAYSRSMTLTAGTRADGSSLYTILSPIGARINIANSVGAATARNYSINAGGVHQFGNLKIEYNANMSRAENDPDPEENYSINYNSTGYGFNVFNVAGNAVASIVQTGHGGEGIIAADDPRSYLNLKNYNSLSYQHNFTYGDDTRLGAKINATLPVVLRIPFTSYDIPIEIKMGASYGEQQRNTHRYMRARRLTGGSTQPSFLTPAEPTLLQFADAYFGNSWGFDVPIPTWVNPYLIQDYYDTHANSFYDTTTDEWEGNLYNELRNEKETKEATLAGYLMLTLRLHPTLTMITGFRYESMTNSGAGNSYEGYQDGDGHNKYDAGYIYDSVTPQLPQWDLTDPDNPVFYYIDNPRLNWTQEDKVRYLFTRTPYKNPAITKLLPNFQLKWTPHKDWNVRFARSESIGRPKFANVLYEERWRDSTRTIERTNPSLKPSSSEKYDVAVEYYPGRDGMLTLSLFYQKFKDIIYDNTTFLTVTHVPEEASGSSVIYDETHPAGIWAVNTPGNVGKGQNQGFEITYRQKLGFIHSSLRGFEVYGAFSYADPETEYQRHTLLSPTLATPETQLQYLMSPLIWETIPMQGIQKRTANLQLRYDSRVFSGKIAAYWVDEFARGIRRDIVEITNQNSSLKLDLSLTYKISSRWTISFDWRNMTNVGDDRKIFDRTGGYFTSGMVMNLGVRANF